jgi:1,4-alpha-glucan branching enzyme
MNAKDSTLIYLRKGMDGTAPVLVCSNFTPVVRHGYRVGVPESGFWKEIFNSDSAAYGGTNVGNYPGCETLGSGHHDRPDSISIKMPPLATVIFQLEQ